jgi:prepilin-type N-terminal cleavage/methylation domain-containing protein
MRGFTLIETMVAISLLTIAIVTPMSLASQSLSTAYYARDQIAAFHFAQEAIEAVRSVRDGHILNNALTGVQTDLLAGIPIGSPFTIDTRNNTIEVCGGVCPPLETDGTLYGYGDGGSAWIATRYTRTALATYVDEPDEVRVAVTVEWKTAGARTRSFTISENVYRWVTDGTQ